MEGDYFIVREYGKDDYGIDIIIEVIIDKEYASNFTACVQLKDKLISENMKKVNGEYSYTVNLKNINYLSNQPNSLIFIYLEDKNIFIWEWVENILKLADISSGNKKTVTYRFNKFLDEKSKLEIHSKIIRISESLREFSRVISKRNESLIYKEIDKHQIGIIEAFDKKCVDAEQYINKEDFNKALKIYKDILKIYDNKDILMRCAELEFKLKKYNQALSNFNKVINIDLRNKKAFWGAICCYKSIKQHKKEKRYIESKINNIKFAEAYCELARLYIIDGVIDKAIELLLEACVLEYLYEENIQVPKLFLAEIYLNSFNFDKAKEYIDLILKEDSKNNNAMALLGEYYFQLNEYAKAIDKFSVAAESEKYNFYSLRGLSLIYFDMNEYKKALVYFKDWVNIINPKSLRLKGKFLIIHIGWKRTIAITYEIDDMDFVNIYLENGKSIKTPLSDIVGNIMIGVMKDLEKQYIYPIVGKIYDKKTDYILALDNIKKNLRFMELNKGQGCNIEITSKTNLYIEEKRNNVYINIDFNGYIINGFTDMKNENKAYKEFMDAYNKNGFYQVSIICKESKEEFCYSVNNKVKVKNK